MKQALITFLQNQKHTVNVQSKTQFDKLMKYLSDYGFTWNDGSHLTNQNMNLPFGDLTTIMMNDSNNIVFSTFSTDKNFGYSVISLNDFVKNVTDFAQQKINRIQQGIQQLNSL